MGGKPEIVGQPKHPPLQNGLDAPDPAHSRNKTARDGLSLRMKFLLPPAIALLSILALPLCAEDAKPLLNQPGKVISAPDFKQPLGPEWSVAKGKWVPADGLLSITDIPDEKHIPVLHLATGPVPLIWECEFKFNNGKSFLVGCDAQKHVGRVVIGPKSFKIAEDSTEVKGKVPSHTLQETVVDLKPDEWHKLRVESAGDQVAARLDGQELKAQHPYLATPKVRWWFAAADSAQIRNVRVTEGEPLPAAAK
jgi:hypothetical protein